MYGYAFLLILIFSGFRKPGRDERLDLYGVISVMSWPHCQEVLVVEFKANNISN